jgi:anaerobic magnesium-protoporphyrin IX monomethyl ester cyclase
MSILLVRPGYSEPYKSNFIRYFSMKYPPLNLATLAAEAENAKILDLPFFRKPEEVLRKTIENENFDFIGFTVLTPLMEEVKKMIGIARTCSSSKIIIGGPHVTALPKESLIETDADIACVGEGEITLREIISGKALHRVKGTAFFRNDVFFLKPHRELIGNLDALEYPRWDLTKTDNYYSIFSKRNPTGIIETSRGCPYNCIYCHKKTFGRLYRAKSPKRVVDEMENAIQAGFREIHIIDDAFSVDRKRVQEICREIVKRGLNIPWALPNGLRVDSVDETLFGELHAAGCHMIAMGVESGSEKILKKIDKGINKKQIREAFRYARSAGIETLLAMFMVGLPYETKEDIKKTAEFAKELDADITKVSVTIPYPGTRLYEKYMKNDKLVKEFSWSSYRLHNPERIYNHETLEWEEIKRGYLSIMKRVYLNPPHYICRARKILGVYAPRFFKNYIQYRTKVHLNRV